MQPALDDGLDGPDHALTFITELLERVERTAPDTVALYRAFALADMALGCVDRALDREIRAATTAAHGRTPAVREDDDTEYDDLTEICHRAYLAAVLLARTIDLVPGPRTPRLVSFRRTATNMLRCLERLARPEDVAFRARVLGEPGANN